MSVLGDAAREFKSLGLMLPRIADKYERWVLRRLEEGKVIADLVEKWTGLVLVEPLVDYEVSAVGLNDLPVINNG